METKKEIRKRICQKRNELSPFERQEKSRMIEMMLLQSKEFQEAKQVLAFVSYLSEVDTTGMIQTALNLKKDVFVPRICDGQMLFFQIYSLSELKEGYKGILEPEPIMEKKWSKSADEVDSNTKTILFMPGVAFDRLGNRIGYGKGFYDRFLEKGFYGTKIALAFELQVVATGSFEVDTTDIRPDALITEKGRYQFS